MAIVAARFWAALKPLARPAMTMLAASRLTSHSQGPGSVSSKSLASNTRRRSGDANRPKFEQVGVAAGLHDDVRAGRRGEVEGHHRGRAAVVGEGRLRHARVTQRDQVGQPVGLLRARGWRSGRGRPGARRRHGWCAARACAGADPPRVVRRGGPTVVPSTHPRKAAWVPMLRYRWPEPFSCLPSSSSSSTIPRS